jgi:hypothetical protein
MFFDDVNEETTWSCARHVVTCCDVSTYYVNNYELRRMLAPKWRSCCEIEHRCLVIIIAALRLTIDGKSHSVERRLAPLQGAMLLL